MPPNPMAARLGLSSPLYSYRASNWLRLPDGTLVGHPRFPELEGQEVDSLRVIQTVLYRQVMFQRDSRF